MKSCEEKCFIIACDSDFIITDILAVKNLDINIKIKDHLSRIVLHDNLSRFLDFTINLKNKKCTFGNVICVVDENNSITVMNFGGAAQGDKYIITAFSNHLGFYEDQFSINNEQTNLIREQMKASSIATINYRNFTELNNETINIQRQLYKKNADVLDLLGKKQEMMNIIETQKNFFKQMLNAIPDLIFYKDVESKYLGCNKAFAEQFIGLTEEEIIGKTDLDFVKDETLARFFRQKDKEVLDARVVRSNEERLKMLDNSIIDVETIKTPFFDETGKLAGLIGVSRNVSLRKSMEEKLSVSEEKFRLLFENMTNGFTLNEVILNEKGEPVDFRFLMVNKGYEVQMNKRSEDILGKTILEVNTAADKEIIKKCCEVGLTGKPLKLEYFSKAFNRYFSTYIYSTQKGLFASIFEDITEKKENELELVKAKEQAESANVMKSRFLANMSHEIRTPMSSVLGYLDLLAKTSLSSEQKELMKDARIASEMLLYLINDILDLSKIEAGKLEMEKIPFDLRTIIDEAISLLTPKASEKKLKLLTMIKSNVPEKVEGDPGRLRQIIINLVGNAVKFSEFGEITVIVEMLAENDERATIRFQIKDTGIGISEEEIKTLFKPFVQADTSTTRKHDGTGLGLAISSQLVKMMGGDISVESEPGIGSTFNFSINAKVIQKNPGFEYSFNKNEEEPKEKSLSTKLTVKETINELKPKILLVEDNEMIRKIIIKMLKHKNMTCDIAINGSEAINAVVEKKYDIVFMDCQLPVMDGYESTARIRAIEGDKKHTKIVAMTANAMDGDRAKCIRAGMDDYISKPIDFENMFKMIELSVNYKEQNWRNFNLMDDNIDTFVSKTGLTKGDARELFEDYFKYVHNLIEDIYKAIESNDFEKISQIAHQLKGSSGTLRVNSIYELAIAIQNSALNQEIDKCKSLLVEIQKLLYLQSKRQNP